MRLRQAACRARLHLVDALLFHSVALSLLACCQQTWEAREARAGDDDARRRRRRLRSGVPAIRSTPAGGPRRSRRWSVARGGVAPQAQARAWSSVQRIGSGRAAMARGGEAARRRWVGRRLAATAHVPRALWRSGFGARLQCGRSFPLIVSVSKSSVSLVWRKSAKRGAMITRSASSFFLL